MSGNNLNWVDKLVGTFNPESAYKRSRYRAGLQAAANYDKSLQRREALRRGAETTEIEVAGLGQGKREYRKKLVKASLLQLETNPLAHGIVGKKTAHVVGGGFRLLPRVDGKALEWDQERTDEFNELVVREWQVFANSTLCDDENTCNFSQLTRLMYRCMLETGDAFCILLREETPDSPYNLRLMVISGDRVVTPQGMEADATIIDGVKIGVRGRPEGYFIDLGGPRKANEPPNYQYVPIRGANGGQLQVMHLFRKVKAGQKRGYPDLSIALSTLNDLNEYSESELKAAQVSSLFTGFIKSADPSLDDFGGLDEDGEQTGDENAPRLQSGALMSLGPNEEVQFANPSRPQSNFDTFMQSQYRKLGIALGVPYEVLIGHFSASYSASKGSVVLGQRYFLSERTILAEMFLNKVYEEWFAEAVEKGRIDAPDFNSGDPVKRQAYLRNTWIGDGAVQLDEQKAAGAAKTRLETKQSSLQQEIQERNGGDWRQVLEQIAEEDAYMRELGIKQEMPAAFEQNQGDSNEETEEDDETPEGDEETPDNGEQEPERANSDEAPEE